MTAKNGVYKVDDGKGGFDEINFKTIAAQVFFSDGENLDDKINRKPVLWQGSSYLIKKSAIVRPSKPISKCQNGWVLVFSDYDVGGNGVGNNYNYSIHYVPKNSMVVNSGNVFFLVPNTENGNSVVKACYIKDNEIQGQSLDNVDGWNDVVLRQVLEY